MPEACCTNDKLLKQQHEGQDSSQKGSGGATTAAAHPTKAGEEPPTPTPADERGPLLLPRALAAVTAAVIQTARSAVACTRIGEWSARSKRSYAGCNGSRAQKQREGVVCSASQLKKNAKRKEALCITERRGYPHSGTPFLTQI